MKHAPRKITGFPPVERGDARVLILGSMPSEESLRKGQYYGHPQNQFWRIVPDVLGFPVGLPYEQRTEKLRENGVALWDVVMTCRRKGSLDANIKDEAPNDIEDFLRGHPLVRRIILNGQTAATLLRRHWRSIIPADVETLTLPSTSPACATLSYERKLELWRAALAGNPKFESRNPKENRNSHSE